MNNIGFKIPRFCFLAVTVLLIMSVCVYAGDMENKLKLLDDAYNAGLLSKEEYEQKRQALKTDNAGKKNNKKAGPPLNIGEKGQMLTHPTGITVWCPKGWQTKMLDGILQMVPPDAGQGENYESYFLTSESVEGTGIQQADHPSVIQYLDEQMMALGYELGVAFQRHGTKQTIATGQGQRNGIRLDYRANSNYGPVNASAYATIVKGWGLVFAGVGVGDRLDRRSQSIKRIFSSFDVGEGQKDQRLVGNWHLLDTRAITNQSVWETDYSRAKLVSEDSSSIRFNPDGTWYREDRSHMIAGAGGVWLEDKSSSKQSGRWNADGKHLFLLWEDGSFANYEYRFEGNNLKMAYEKTLEVWTRQ